MPTIDQIESAYDAWKAAGSNAVPATIASFHAMHGFFAQPVQQAAASDPLAFSNKAKALLRSKLDEHSLAEF